MIRFLARECDSENVSVTPDALELATLLWPEMSEVSHSEGVAPLGKICQTGAWGRILCKTLQVFHNHLIKLSEGWLGKTCQLGVPWLIFSVDPLPWWAWEQISICPPSLPLLLWLYCAYIVAIYAIAIPNGSYRDANLWISYLAHDLSVWFRQRYVHGLGVSGKFEDAGMLTVQFLTLNLACCLGFLYI